MATRINSPHDIKGYKQPEFPYKATKSSTFKRKASTKKIRKAHKIRTKSEHKTILDLKNSLRQECLRLASFLKQESFRPGYVR